ncbi:hypothetical protein RYX36_007285 [Vicia faba]
MLIMHNFLCTVYGLNNLPQMNTQVEIMYTKHLNFVAPDEASCISSMNHCKRVGMNRIKGQWTVEEDGLLVRLVEQYGLRKWSNIAQKFPGKSGKQCRERWHNHLNPNIKKESWSEEEDKILIKAHREMGNKWTEIAKRLPGRTDNAIKNHWNSTKRRECSKRKHYSRYPRATLLQEYIKSLNLNKNPENANVMKDDSTGSAESQKAEQFDRIECLVPSFNSDIDFPDFYFDENLIQDGYSIGSLLNDF